MVLGNPGPPVVAWLMRLSENHRRFAPGAVYALLTVTLALILNYGLPDDYRTHAFLLWPLRWLSTLAGGLAWTGVHSESGLLLGFQSADGSFLLAPECSGLRFFSLTLVATAIAGIRPGLSIRRLACLPLAAYTLALLAGLARVLISVRLAGLAPGLAHSGHAFIGGAIYLTFFVAALVFMDRSSGSSPVLKRPETRNAT